MATAQRSMTDDTLRNDGNNLHDLDFCNPDHPPIRGLILAGLSLIAFFLLGFSAWSSTAPLKSAVIAQGTVILDTYRKTVEHLEGGIVRKIHVREGDKVAKGQVLISLDKTRARSKIDLLEAQAISVAKQLEMITEELSDVEKLFGRGLATKSRVLAIKRRKVELEGERIGKLAELRAANDVILRSDIRAPTGGTVINLSIHTAGSVIKPGENLLSIVPQEEPLVIEARLDPNDIDVVQKNYSVEVRLTPFNARMIPPIPGRVIWTSADILTDQQKGTSYYLTRVLLDSKPKSFPKDLQLYPGMPAEVMIITGQRTFMDYLIAPISRSFRRAFREQ